MSYDISPSLTSLCMTVSRSNHVAANGMISSLFNGWGYSHSWTQYSLYHVSESSKVCNRFYKTLSVKVLRSFVFTWEVRLGIWKINISYTKNFISQIIIKWVLTKPEIVMLSNICIYCCCSVAQLCPTLSYLMDYSMPGIPVLHHLLELAQTHAHWLSDAIQPSSPLSTLSSPASIFPSIRVFSNELALHIRRPKYWSFRFSPSNEYSGMISFRIDWLQSKGLSGVFSNTQIQKHQFFGA